MDSPSLALDRSVRRLDRGLVALVLGLVGGSLLVWYAPAMPGLTDARALELAINVAATLVGGAVAILAWVRWHENGELVALYESAAFTALTLTNAIVVGIVLGGREREFGLASDAPSAAPIYLWTTARLAAALLLVIGGIRALRRHRQPLRPGVIAFGPGVALVVIALMLFGREATLPPVPGVAVLAPGGPGPLGLGVGSTLVGIVQVVIFGAFIVAAILFRRLFLRERRVSHAFLSAGLVVAAFSQLHFLLDPVVASGRVTTSDALRLGFYAILFLGIQAELEADLRAVRRANQHLRRMGEVEAAAATMAERTRLAREIHDGLAQDLWFAKLKQGRLTGDPRLGDDARETAGEVLGAIDSALADARRAVMTLRSSANGGALTEMVRSAVDDFGDRFGVRVEFRSDDGLGSLPARTEAEIVRIVQEALTNVSRHADATLLRVSIEQDDGRIRVTVADNGRGFDPAAVGARRFGLRGMRERASLVGATIEVVSRPADGTRITIEVPVGEGRP